MDVRYPIGKFRSVTRLDPAQRAQMIDAIAAAPAAMRASVRGLTEAQLSTPYRPEGWTVRQVVHHVPDSHLNAYIRTRLLLTEDRPTIKPYLEQRWAELADAKGPLVEDSLRLLESLHARWVELLRATPPADFARTFLHPEHPAETLTLDWLVASYAWHGRHHVAHITGLRERNGWV
jgi:hypothetical protein